MSSKRLSDDEMQAMVKANMLSALNSTDGVEDWGLMGVQRLAT